MTLPQVERIPTVRFDEAKRLASGEVRLSHPGPLRPGAGGGAEHRPVLPGGVGSDFVFVTHYPAKKRPFYAMDDPEDPRYTLSFDLLFRGLEVTTGGQRIHDYASRCRR